MVKILITRSLRSSESFAQHLGRYGYQGIIEPLLEITPVYRTLQETDIKAVMITSGNALDAIEGRVAALQPLLGLPCFCVGPRTAARAVGIGFREVHSSNGDGGDLARLVDATMGGQGASVLHMAGQDVDSKAQDELGRLGYTVISWVLYKATPVTALTSVTIDRLKRQELDVVTVFSVRTAQTLIGLLKQHALEACCKSLTAIGLSGAVADSLEPLPWRKRLAAQRPTEDAMIECLKRIYTTST